MKGHRADVFFVLGGAAFVGATALATVSACGTTDITNVYEVATDGGADAGGGHDARVGELSDTTQDAATDAGEEVGPLDAGTAHDGAGDAISDAPIAWVDAASCVAPNVQNCQSADLAILPMVCVPPRCILPGYELYWEYNPCPGDPYAPTCITNVEPNPYLTTPGEQCNWPNDDGSACYLVALVPEQ